MSLAICSSCSRHVRETTCPFCGASIAPRTSVTLARMSRIGLVGAAAAAAATTIAACSSAEPMYGCVCPPPDASSDVQQGDAIATFYGGPPIDASSFDSSKNDASDATVSDASDATVNDAGTDGD